MSFFPVSLTFFRVSHKLASIFCPTKYQQNNNTLLMTTPYNPTKNVSTMQIRYIQQIIQKHYSQFDEDRKHNISIFIILDLMMVLCFLSSSNWE
jgi:hypothetical protein